MIADYVRFAQLFPPHAPLIDETLSRQNGYVMPAKRTVEAGAKAGKIKKHKISILADTAFTKTLFCKFQFISTTLR
jgi:hypothetical protein